MSSVAHHGLSNDIGLDSSQSSAARRAYYGSSPSRHRHHNSSYSDVSYLEPVL